jgi:alanine racemase
MARPARVVIDRSAARANLRRVRTLAPNKKIMAIIKADAYGHGLARIAAALSEADAFGVACLEEAQILRAAGISHRIVLLEGPFSGDELAELQRLNIETVLHAPEQVRMIELCTAGPPIHAWIKIDTGMHRLGFAPQEVHAVWQRLQSCAAIAPGIAWMTHLASAHEREGDSVPAQLDIYAHCLRDLPGPRCVANSAAIIAWPQSHADWVRPGLMLYGVSPFYDDIAASDELTAVMTLRSELIAVRRLKAGDAVGYGASWRCPEDMPVGVVAIGYGDGYPRHAESGTPILINGQRAALIGKASMDMLTVDLRNTPAAQVGDPVVLWGEGLPVEEVARCAGTIPYELLCGVRGRARVHDSEN